MQNRVFFDEHLLLMGDFCSRIDSGLIDGIGINPLQLTEHLYSKFDVEDQHLAHDGMWISVRNYYKDTVIPHKVAVFNEGVKLLANFQYKSEKDELLKRLVVHDLSKFSITEHFGYYSYNFKENDKNSDIHKLNFQQAWHHHKINNDHHPEHWLSVNRNGTTTPMIMPRMQIVEMVADWMGAGITYGSTLEKWLPGNISTFVFHNTTARYLSTLLNQVTGLKFKAEGDRVLIF